MCDATRRLLDSFVKICNNTRPTKRGRRQRTALDKLVEFRTKFYLFPETDNGRLRGTGRALL